jgi:hypothetical protein
VENIIAPACLGLFIVKIISLEKAAWYYVMRTDYYLACLAFCHGVPVGINQDQRQTAGWLAIEPGFGFMPTRLAITRVVQSARILP